MKLDLDTLAKDLLTLSENLTATDEIARHAAGAQSVHAAHLLVIEAILIAVLRQHPTDLDPVRAQIAAMPDHQRQVASLATSLLDSISKAVER